MTGAHPGGPGPRFPNPAPFTYGEYTLYGREVELGNGTRRRVWFFAAEMPPSATPVAMPVGYHVAIHPRTGLPFLEQDALLAWNLLPRANRSPHANPRAGHQAS